MSAMIFPFRIPDTITITNTIWGRIKRAVKILFGKPIYYNDLHLEGEERFHKLVGDMEELERLEYAGGEEQ